MLAFGQTVLGQASVPVRFENHTTWDFIGSINTDIYGTSSCGSLGTVSNYYYDIPPGIHTFFPQYTKLLDEQGNEFFNRFNIVGITMEEIGNPCWLVSALMCSSGTITYPGSINVNTPCLGTITVEWRYNVGVVPNRVEIVIK